MAAPIVVLGTTSLWPTTGDTGYSAQALQLQQLLASAVDPIKGLYNSTTGHVGQLALNNSDQLTVNGVQVGGVLSFNTRTGNITLTSLDVTDALGYTPAVAGSGVTTFNTRTGAVTLTSSDVTTALGYTPGTGAGSVTSVAASGSNGIGITGSPITTSGTLAFSLGDITPTSVAATGTVTGSNLSGTNTGDQTLNSLLPSQTGNSGKVLSTDGTNSLWSAAGAGSVTLVTGTNGVTVATGTTTPVIGLGSITPTDISTGAITTSGSLTFSTDNFVKVPTSFQINAQTLNSAAFLRLRPNGTPATGLETRTSVYNVADASNYARIDLAITDTTAYVTTLATGTGTALPLGLGTLGQRNNILIDTSHNVSISNNLAVTGTVTGSNLSGTNTGDQTLNSLLPTQTGNSGKYLTTDGTNSSWGTVLSGVTSFNTRTGAITLTSLDVTDALGYTPGSGSGTVTSVAVSGANGIGVASSPITTSGTIVLSLGSITPTDISTGAITTSSNLTFSASRNINVPTDVTVQATTTNAVVNLRVRPNGTPTTGSPSAIKIYSTGDTTNNNYVQLGANDTSAFLNTAANGTGTATLLNLGSSNGTAISIDTSNNTSILNNLQLNGIIQQTAAASFNNSSNLNLLPRTTSPTASSGLTIYNSSDSANSGRASFVLNPTTNKVVFNTNQAGTGVAPTEIDFLINSSTVQAITSTGVAVTGVTNHSGTSSPIQLNGSAGTTGQVLTSAGAGATPTWTTPSAGSGLTTAQALQLNQLDMANILMSRMYTSAPF